MKVFITYHLYQCVDVVGKHYYLSLGQKLYNWLNRFLFCFVLFCFSMHEGTTSECGYHSRTQLCSSRTIPPGSWHEQPCMVLLISRQRYCTVLISRWKMFEKQGKNYFENWITLLKLSSERFPELLRKIYSSFLSEVSTSIRLDLMLIEVSALASF